MQTSAKQFDVQPGRFFKVAFYLLVLSLVSSGLAQGKFRLDGEYGLWIERADKELTVHWITAEVDSGFISAYQENKLIFEAKTPSSQAHKATFEAKKKDKPLRLSYGGQSSETDRHETVLNLREKRPSAKYSKIDSVYVLGDIHGQYDSLRTLLTHGGIINADGKWSAGKNHLIALGDLFDRGHDVTKVLWFLYELEQEAEKSGGRVDIVLGNHEIMTFLNDLRYVSGKENLIASLYETGYANLFHPEHSLLGRWLATKPALLEIDHVLYAHGGLDPLYSGYSISQFNDLLNDYLHEDIFFYLLQDSLAYARFDSTLYRDRLYFFFGGKSVFWHRGYVLSDTLEPQLRSVLDRHEAYTHVIAHTPVRTISKLYGGKIIAVDLLAPATEMLLLVRNGKTHDAFKVDLEGSLEPL